MGDLKQILLIDPNSASRKDTMRCFDPDTYRVLEADSAERGLSLCSECEPDVVFIDTDLDGVLICDVIRTICRENSSILVAVIAEPGNERLVINALKSGALDYLQKPLMADGINTVLSRFAGIVSRRTSRVFQKGLILSGEISLELENSDRVVTPAVETVMSLMRGVASGRELQRLEVGLHEIVRNAYEHGNLGIDREEKREHCASGELENVLSDRQKRFSSDKKSIRVVASFDGEELICRVEDDGNGFDWREFMAASSPIESLSGRGICLAREFFDEVSFNEKGNAVTLRTKIGDGSSRTAAD